MKKILINRNTLNEIKISKKGKYLIIAGYDSHDSYRNLIEIQISFSMLKYFIKLINIVA
jgi:hypothetical protein